MEDYISGNEPPLIIAMIETTAGVENIDDIASNVAIDGIMVGPYDLSSSLGCPGKFSSKVFVDSVRAILRKTREHGKFCGIHVLENYKGEIRNRCRQGYQFLPISTDAKILVDGVGSIGAAIDQYL